MTRGRAETVIESMDDMLRAADRDRDEVADVLREQYALGRLTLEEFDERTTAAVSARTLGELRALTVDLPAPAAARPAAWSPARMRWTALAGVVATVLLVGGAVAAGHAALVWLLAVIVIRHARGHRGASRGRS
jgi:Domain of unknown function (DUF1707)